MWSSDYRLTSVTKADGNFKPVLASEGSFPPDWLDVLGNQALHFHGRGTITNPQEFPACFDPLGEVSLILMLLVIFFCFHITYNCGTEIMENGTCPYFQHDILVFFCMKNLQA